MSSRRANRTIRVYCASCGHLLYKYRKGGAGRLVKCFKDGIVQDNTEADLRCPSCEQAFARETMAYGRPANKIIQGKVTVTR
jgi:ribosomal protein S27E